MYAYDIRFPYLPDPGRISQELTVRLYNLVLNETMFIMKSYSLRPQIHLNNKN